MKTSSKGIDLIKHFEGLHDGNLSRIGLQPKMCPAGIWTVGYGHALRHKVTGKWLRGTSAFKTAKLQYPELMNMTESEAESLLKQDLELYEGIVERRLSVALQQHEFDALVSHAYNTGGSHTIFSMINRRAQIDELLTWWRTHYITGDGKRLPGLIRRRKSEAILFECNQLNFYP